MMIGTGGTSLSMPCSCSSNSIEFRDFGSNTLTNEKKYAGCIVIYWSLFFLTAFRCCKEGGYLVYDVTISREFNVDWRDSPDERRLVDFVYTRLTVHMNRDYMDYMTTHRKVVRTQMSFC